MARAVETGPGVSHDDLLRMAAKVAHIEGTGGRLVASAAIKGPQRTAAARGLGGRRMPTGHAGSHAALSAVSLHRAPRLLNPGPDCERCPYCVPCLPE